MIFVTLGTQDKPFPRLLKMLEDALTMLGTEEEILVQAGSTKYKSPRLKLFDYADMTEFDQLLARADLVITHGGVGTVLAALQKGKKVIGCPRLAMYGEHHNNHQYQLLDSFRELGYILTCGDQEELKDAILASVSFQPKPYPSNRAAFVQLVMQEIEDS